MVKGIETPENRERAFRVWMACRGRDIARILDILEEEYGIRISRPTLRRWAKEGNWRERLALAEDRKMEALAKDPALEELEKRLLFRLLHQVEKYGRYLEGTAVVDNQAAFALTNLIKAAVDIRRSLPDTRDPEEWRRRAQAILKYDYGIEQAGPAPVAGPAPSVRSEAAPVAGEGA